MAERKYTKGLWYNFPSEKAPKWVLGRLSIKKVDFMEWLKNQVPNEKGYINIDILNGKENKPYCALNEYKSAVATAKEVMGGEEVSADGVPF